MPFWYENRFDLVISILSHLPAVSCYISWDGQYIFAGAYVLVSFNQSVEDGTQESWANSWQNRPNVGTMYDYELRCRDDQCCLSLLSLGKRVHIRKPAITNTEVVPERKRSTPINPANTIRKCLSNNPVSQRPFRDRLIHLLALRPYKKLEVLARLQRDGINQKDRTSLGTTLQQVLWSILFVFFWFF